jgi:hypothetical protein
MGISKQVRSMILSGGPHEVVRVVARINYLPEGDVFGWAAYIGSGTEEEVAENGDKLLDKHAAAFFPDLPIEKYRD